MKTHPATTRSRRLDAITIALFAAALFAPPCVQWLRLEGPGATTRMERRAPAPFPDFELSLRAPELWLRAIEGYPDAFGAWYGDAFGLRRALLRGNSLAKLFVFGVSPTSSVLLGREGWMYYTGEESLRTWRGLAPFTALELEAWRTGLEARRDELAQRGIEYLFVLGPSKESIYPEYLPARESQLGPTRTDQLVQYLRERAAQPFLDLRPAFLAEKVADGRDDFLYYRLGTHWNGRGWELAYREILARLRERFPGAQSLDEIELAFVPAVEDRDNWAEAMYVADLFPQSARDCVPNEARAQAVERSPLDASWIQRTRVDDPRLPRALLFHDSFGQGVNWLLAQHFSRLTCSAHPFDEGLVEAEQPDVVIELFVERILQIGTWLPARGPDQEALRRDFESSRVVAWRLEPQAELEPFGSTRVIPGTRPGEPCVTIRTESATDMLYLPVIPLAGAGRVSLLVDISAPEATTFNLYYRVGSETEYKRRNTIAHGLAAGRNRFFLELDEPRITGRLLIRPGKSAGEYHLHALEVRTSTPARGR